MDKKFRVGVILLLSGILVMLVAIYLKIPNNPPTLGDLRTAKGEARKILYMKRPLVYVDGSVNVE